MNDRERSINFIINYITKLCDEFNICIVVDKETNES